MKTKDDSVKITALELENIKRIKAVRIVPTENGLTVIGGKNNQGKTSVLDGIAYALGGSAYKPSTVKRDGSMVDPYLKVTLSNGLIVERKGKDSTLTVTDPSGKRSGQTLLDSFISTFALDLPKFMSANDKEKARVLLQILGIGDQLAKYEKEEQRLYDERQAIGRIAREKQGHADQMPQWDGVPAELISASDLIKQQQEILARNGENQRKRDRLREITMEKHRIADEITRLEAQMSDLKERLKERKEIYEQTRLDEETAMKTVAQLVDESTEELEDNLADIEAINVKIRQNLEKEKAQIEADAYSQQYKDLNQQIDKLRDDRMKLLDGADLPLKGLGVDQGVLTYNGQAWDGMSGSDQLRVATAIVRKLKPECGFVLLDKLEQMDLDTLQSFTQWLESEGLQAIGTRVSTGDECTIYIEDGYSVDHDGKKTADEDLKPAEMSKAPEPEFKPKWKAGEF